MGIEQIKKIRSDVITDIADDVQENGTPIDKLILGGAMILSAFQLLNEDKDRRDAINDYLEENPDVCDAIHKNIGKILKKTLIAIDATR